MEDSSSDTTHDEVDSQTYTISFEDMCRLKDKITTLEAEVRAIHQSVSDIKPSLDNPKYTSLVL